MKNRIVSFSLMALNVGVFIWMALGGVSVFSPSSQALIAWGGSFNEALLQGQWWRLFSCMFLHAGILHLLMNMYALNSIGALLEPVLGKDRFLIAYFLSGLMASLVSALYHADNFIVGVGASGAIFGLFGVLLAFISTKYFEAEVRGALGKSMVTTLVINLVYGFQAGVDLAAHIGGLVAGFVIGYCLYLSLSVSRKRLSFSLLILGVGCVMSLGIHKLRDNDALAFNRFRGELTAHEDEVQQILKALRYKPAWEMKKDLDQLILPGWQKMKSIADQMNPLKLSGQKAQMRNSIVEWTYLQAEKFDLIVRSMEENTGIYEGRIRQIDARLSEISP